MDNKNNTVTIDNSFTANENQWQFKNKEKNDIISVVPSERNPKPDFEIDSIEVISALAFVLCRGSIDSKQKLA